MLELQRKFKVMNSGIMKGKGENKISVVPAELLEEELVYEKEIPPGVCRHIVKTLQENSKDILLAKKMLNVLCTLNFDNKCTQQANQIAQNLRTLTRSKQTTVKIHSES